MKIIKCSFIIIGGIIGAGFASGKEIFEYFAKFGFTSLFYIIPLFFIFFISLKIYLLYGSSHKCFILKKENDIIAPKIKFCNIKFNYLNVFMFFTFLILSSAMYSSIISLFSTYFPNLNWVIIYGIIFIFSYFIMNKSVNFLSSITYIVVPIIIICIIANSTLSLSNLNLQTTFNVNNFWALPVLTLLYASQNTFLSSFIIIKSGENTSKKEQTYIALLVSTILCLLIIFGILCFLSCPNIYLSDMPFAELSISISPIFSLVFAVIIFLSIITTYFTTLSSLKEYFSGDKKYNKPIVMLGLIALCSLLNFGTIVEYLYPCIGCFGVVYLFKIFKYNKDNVFCKNMNSLYIKTR